MKELKKAAITFRVQPQLKERFQQALEREGVTQSQFFVAKILAFCEQSESKQKGESYEAAKAEKSREMDKLIDEISR